MISFEEFEEKWWDKHPRLAKTELGTNGQFDEFPYDAYDEYKKGMSLEKALIY